MNIETGQYIYMFSFRAAPRCLTCSDRFRPFTATRTEAEHLVTVPYHSARLALGALGARIRFFFSRTLRRGRSKYVKSENGTKELYPHIFCYDCHISIAHRSQRKISTKQRALGSRAPYAIGMYTHPPEVGVLPLDGSLNIPEPPYFPLLHTSHTRLMA